MNSGLFRHQRIHAGEMIRFYFKLVLSDTLGCLWLCFVRTQASLSLLLMGLYVSHCKNLRNYLFESKFGPDEMLKKT